VVQGGFALALWGELGSKGKASIAFAVTLGFCFDPFLLDTSCQAQAKGRKKDV